MNEQNFPQPNEPIQSSKNIWIIIVSIVITALVVGGAVYAWQNSMLKSSEEKLQQQITLLQNQIHELQPKGTESPVDQIYDEIEPSDNIDQQQAYGNDQYGFSLNYPINWTLSEKATTDSVVKIERYFTNKYGDNDGAYLNIAIFRGISIDAQSWINEKHPINEAETLHETKTLNIDGENGIYRVITSNVAGGYFNDLIIKHKGDIYYITTMIRIRSDYEKENKEYQEDVDLIINSIKFNK